MCLKFRRLQEFVTSASKFSKTLENTFTIRHKLMFLQQSIFEGYDNLEDVSFFKNLMEILQNVMF